MHYIDVYRKELHHYSTIYQPDELNAFILATWLQDRGIELFKKAFKQETTHPVANLPDEKLIEQAYPKSLNEVNKKEIQQTFYSSNAKLFCKICSYISNTIVANDVSDPRSEVFASQHYFLLRQMAMDAIFLLSDWAALMQDIPIAYGVGNNPFHSPFEISHAAQQVAFGGSPFFAFSDLATHTATAVLRVALETRIRYGFGLLGVLDLSNQTVIPLNMGTILEAIKVHKSGFTLAIPLEHIARIYGWANIYVHIGLKLYSWSPIFALEYLNPLFRGVNHPNIYSVHSGIQIDKQTLTDVQNEAEQAIKLNPQTHRLIRLTPDKCDVVLI